MAPIEQQIATTSVVENREAITLKYQGEKIFGILHRPLCEHPVPVVLICPGFAGNKCGKFRLFVSLGKQLAQAGIAVLRFDYRGSGDSEGEFSDITLEGKINDTLSCLDFLANDPLIDANRIGILGRSLGGAIAVLAARRHQHIKSLALWAPVFKSDPWQKLWNAMKSKSLQGEPQINAANQALLKNLPANIPNLEFLKQFFSLQLDNELKELQHIPLLHIHGALDQVVHIEHAKDFENVRAGIGQSHFIRLPNSDHDFSDSADQLTILKETKQWYQQTL